MVSHWWEWWTANCIRATNWNGEPTRTVSVSDEPPLGPQPLLGHSSSDESAMRGSNERLQWGAPGPSDGNIWEPGHCSQSYLATWSSWPQVTGPIYTKLKATLSQSPICPVSFLPTSTCYCSEESWLSLVMALKAQNVLSQSLFFYVLTSSSFVSLMWRIK